MAWSWSAEPAEASSALPREAGASPRPHGDHLAATCTAACARLAGRVAPLGFGVGEFGARRGPTAKVAGAKPPPHDALPPPETP